MSSIKVFDDPIVGTVTVGHYSNTVHQFLWSTENDLAIWYYSSTFDTWFKEEEIDFGSQR